MKIRVTLRGREPAPTVLVTADATATVGDLASAIVSAGAAERFSPPPGAAWTLHHWDRISTAGRTLSPATDLVEAGVRSGSTIEVTEVAADTHLAADQAAVLRVVRGTDRGIEVPLRFGTSTVGRTQGNDVRLSDPEVSGKHARITVGERVEILDNNSSNGVLVGGHRVSRAVLGPGDIAQLGSTEITVESLRTATGPAPTSSDISFVRPPVVVRRPKPYEVALPDVPEPPERQPFPLLAMAAPLLLGAGMFLLTRSALSLVFVALSPVIMIGNYLGNRIDARRRERSALAAFESGLAEGEKRIRLLLGRELERREALYPSVRTCVEAAFGLGPLLWSRRPEHPEFLHVRLGTGSIHPAARFAERRGGGRPELTASVSALTARYRRLDGAPVVADLASVGGVGIVGPAGMRESVARAVVTQVATLHSPAEVCVVGLTSTINKAHWDWLEWLPHTSSPHSPLAGAHLAAEAGSGQVLMDHLDELVAARTAANGSPARPRHRGPLQREETTTAPVTPSVLVVVHDPVVDPARLTSIAERGPDAGVHVLWVAERHQLLPAACRTYLDLGDGSSAVIGMVRSEQTIDSVSTESIDVATATDVARRLAPVVDSSVPVSDESDLPRMVSMVAMLGQDDPDNESVVLDRWRQNGSYTDRRAPAVVRERGGDLRALVGHAGVEPFSLDLRSQGPHALVGGTTGAGKSEFLQAWVLGLAHAYSPDRLTFLFIDYKGGSAFATCVKLPHTVGLVTDLSPYLVRRALRSLRAEIRYREHLLNDKGAKDLIDLEKTGDHDCPPSLVIVVDEFAALLSEVPEFVEGVVDVAQRGRSLGLHLILATQRPAGVIKDNLRANTNLRVALRMNDEHDSTDVLGAPLAAHFDTATPGRAAARTGPGRITVFQSVFPGARTSAEPPPAEIDIVETDFGLTRPWAIPSHPRAGSETPKDIERLVRSVSAAARLGQVPVPRKPWLDVLANAYDLAVLNQRSDDRIVLGMVDDPDNQQQVTEHFRPESDGNILYIGTSGSGKTTALRSLATASSITPRGGPVHVYGLDFSGGGLTILEPLPNVGAIVTGDDEERVNRLLAMLAGMCAEREGRYNAQKASSLSEYRRLAGQPQEPRILLLLDGFEAFKDAYDSALTQHKAFSAFQSVLAAGRAVGIHVAMTTDRLGAVPNAIAGTFQRKIVLRLTDEDAYLSTGIPKDILNPQSPPGRCVQIGRPQELQLAIIGRNATPAAQAGEIEELALAVVQFHPVRPPGVGLLPASVPASDMPRDIGGRPVLGVEDGALAPISFLPEGVFMVAGPARSGRSSALNWFAHSLSQAYPDLPMVHLAARASARSATALWRADLTGAERVKDYLSTTLLDHARRPAGSRPQIAVFIEDYPEFAGSATENEVAELVRQVRRNGHILFATGEPAGFSGGFSALMTEIKNGRAGMLLWPEPSDGDLLKTALPRFKKSEMPPGRGYFVQAGKAWRVQLPWAG